MEKDKKKFNLAFPAEMTPDKKRTLQYFIFVFLLTALIFLGLWNLVVSPANSNRFEKATETLLQAQKKALVDYKSSVIQQLSIYAQQEQTQFLLRTYEKEAFNNIQIINDQDDQFFDLQQRVLNSINHTKKVQFYLPQQAQKEKDSGGSISFVELDMINRMEKNDTVYPEIAKSKDSDEWEIHWVIPIHEKVDNQLKTDSLPIAVLYTSTSLEGLEKAMSMYDQQSAKTQLLQQIGRQRILRFLTVGNGGGYGLQKDEVPFSHWQIEIMPSAYLLSQASYIPLWLIALLVSLFSLGLWAAYVMAQRKNSQEAALYQALDVKTTEPKAKIAGAESKNQKLSDPLYLSDQQLIIDDADQALVDGSHQKKEHNPLSETTSPGATKVNAANQKQHANFNVPEHIFRAYDIRGLIDEELTVELAEAVGKAVATEALEQGETSLVVGYDARSHSPLLHKHLTQGIISTGCDVIQAGLIPTPLMNFAAVFSDQTSSGIVITASHNPKSYNGFKIVINERTLVDDDIKRLYQRITDGVFAEGQKGQIIEEQFAEDYIDTILADIAINSGLHIVIDAANGAASELAPALFNELGCQVTTLFCEFDGEFPNHEPDPSVVSNLEALIDKVKSEQADIGIALDGDGDRIVVVTQSGNIIWPDQLLMLFARDVVSRNPGCDVIFDIKSTRQLNQVISSYGGRPVMWKTGHSHMKAKMKETGALLAGEFSGHIFFKERWFGFDDGIYAAARLLEIMSLRDQSLDEMIEAMPPMVATPEIKIATDEEHKFTIIEKLIESGDFATGEKTTIDGLRVDFDKGWGLVRASNTTAALTLRFEAQNESGIEQLKTLFKRELQKVDRSLALGF